MKRSSCVLAFCLLMSGVLLTSLSVSAQDSPARIPASQIIRSSIRAFIVQCDVHQAPDGDPMGVPVFNTCLGFGWGSGTIISQQGLILTNAHVALDLDTGLPRWLLIGITTDPRELPTLVFFARAKIYDAALDLAVIEPVYTLDGRAIEEGDVNVLPLPMAQDDKSVELEQPLRLIGYPGTGGDTVTIDNAVVSGFGFDSAVPELAGSAWIKTDLAGGAGISGGSTVNDAGLLVGVPTQAGTTEIRCEDINGDGLNDLLTECGAMGGESGYSRPIPEGYNLLLEKARQSGQLDDNGTLPTPTPDPTVPEPPDDGVVITGQIVSADTGDPIEGAVVFVFQPGVTLADANNRQDPSDIYATGVTDSRGEFILDKPVARNQGYAILVNAPGFQSISGDDIVLATDTDPATKNVGVWGMPSV